MDDTGTNLNQNLEQEILKLALQNALKFEGKANSSSLVGRLLSQYAEYRTKKDDLMKIVNKVVDKVNNMPINEQEKMFKEIGDVDILINGVGNFPFEPITSLSQEKFNDVISSNLHSVFYTMKKAIPGMINKGFGRIINFGSAGAEHSVIRKNTTPYYIAKLGVIMLSKNFAAELGNGITVNCISPGVLETSYVKGKTNCRPIKLSEIVDAVLYLISNPSINGANLEISNGWVPGFT